MQTPCILLDDTEHGELSWEGFKDSKNDWIELSENGFSVVGRIKAEMGAIPRIRQVVKIGITDIFRYFYKIITKNVELFQAKEMNDFYAK